MLPVSNVSIREPQSAARLGRTFSESLTALDLAEPLCSLDDNQSLDTAAALLRARRLDVLGVRRNGSVAGWVQASDLTSGLLGDCARTFELEPVLEECAGLGQVLLALAAKERVFILWLGEFAGVITRKDLQKAPLRMWLFGAITLLDLNITEAIEVMHPEDGWQLFVSRGRLDKARVLLEERQRRGTNCRLSDCLQIKDKTDILLRDSSHLTALGFKSRREAERLGRNIESLRNHLAHAQELESEHLETASQLATLIPSIVRAEGVQRIFEARRESKA